MEVFFWILFWDFESNWHVGPVAHAKLVDVAVTAREEQYFSKLAGQSDRQLIYN